MDVTYINSTQFSVIGDYTEEFVANRRIKLDCGVDGTKYCTIDLSSYSAPNTTVTVKEPELTSNLSSVLLSIVIPGNQGGLPDHYHTDTEGDGKPIEFTSLSGTPSSYSDGLYLKATSSGTEWAEAAAVSSFLDLNDTPSFYSDEQFLQSTASGTSWATISGLEGAPGEDGSSWLHGHGTPAQASGTNGDYYLDLDSGDVYCKDTLSSVNMIEDGTNYSASYNNGSAGNALDGNTSTGWPTGHLGVQSEWWKYDFGSGNAQLVSRFRRHGNYSTCTKFRWEGSNNDSDWDILFDQSVSPEPDAGWHDTGVLNHTTEYRYHRIVVLYSGNYGHINEVEFLGSTVVWDLKFNIKGEDGAPGQNGNDAPTTFSGLSDTPNSYDEGKYLISTVSGLEWTTISGNIGAETLLELTDTPSFYDEGKYLISTTSGVEWTTISGGESASTLLELTDTPSSYSNGFYLKSTTSGTEWTSISGTAEWLFGTEEPTNALGEIGNYYLNTDTGELFKKLSEDVAISSDKTSASNTTVSGNYTSSSTTPKEMAIFDNNTSNGAYRNQYEQAWVAYDFNYDSSGDTWAINRIRVHSFRTECANLYFYGSQDAVNWTLLHSDIFTAIGGDNGTHGWNTFDFDNTTEYRYIKVAQDGTNWRHLDELEFIVKSENGWEKQCTLVVNDFFHFISLPDTPSAYDEGKYLISTADGLEWTTISGGITNLIGLYDTPSSYDDGKYLISTTSGTEWATVSGAETFLDLSDTPTTYSGGAYLKSTASGIDYATLYLYGTGDPPSASNYEEGTLYFKYID